MWIGIARIFFLVLWDFPSPVFDFGIREVVLFVFISHYFTCSSTGWSLFGGFHLVPLGCGITRGLSPVCKGISPLWGVSLWEALLVVSSATRAHDAERLFIERLFIKLIESRKQLWMRRAP